MRAWNRVAAGIVTGLALHGPAHAAGPFDGRYTGSSQLTGSLSPKCEQGRARMWRNIEDGRFLFGFTGREVPVEIAKDGSFHAQSGARFLQGKIEGGQLTATVTGSGCSYAWTLNK